MPLRIVTPEIVTSPPVMLNTRLLSLPLIANCAAPGPFSVSAFEIAISPPVNVMTPLTANSIVSPGPASATAWRNDPGPLSAVSLTTIPYATFIPARMSAARIHAPFRIPDGQPPEP